MIFGILKNFGVGICLSEARVKGIDQYEELANYVGSGSFQERVMLMGIAYSISGLDIGFSQLYYSVNNLGESKQTILKPNKDMVVLGLRYFILKDLNVGVTIRNKAELLPMNTWKVKNVSASAIPIIIWINRQKQIERWLILVWIII